MVNLSESAVREIQRLAAEMAREGQGLRFFVQGSCCSRSYGMGFDDPREEDQVLDVQGIKILVGPESIAHIQGLAIDFVVGPEGSGFEILASSDNTQSCCSSREEDDGASGGCCRSQEDTGESSEGGHGCCRH